MEKQYYVIGLDQSTQGTKALLLDSGGRLIGRTSLPHRQIVNQQGWVSHDPMEIYRNAVQAVVRLVESCGVDKSRIAGVGISNQRETSLAWNRRTGEPVGDAIVWQCARAAEICAAPARREAADDIRRRTGIHLSPYFPAAKIAWILERAEFARQLAKEHNLCHGTIDSWLVYRLTGGKSYKTDYSNASRTQLFHLSDLRWDIALCELFGIDPANMAEVCDSDSLFGETDFEGFLHRPVPIHAVLGDSQAALFGQGCLRPGMVKTTYGTGSSVLMNIGDKPVLSTQGLMTSLAWRMDGMVSYVLEGNLNYTGAVITWMKDGLNLISSPDETLQLARQAQKNDGLYLVPAFTGLGAPYWNSRAAAALVGMTRTTRRAEMVRAGLECIAYQVTDVLQAMYKDSGIDLEALLVDGGPTKNAYLMQFQSDIANLPLRVPNTEELSGVGAALMVGIALGLWDTAKCGSFPRDQYQPEMDSALRDMKYRGWQNAVQMVLSSAPAEKAASDA